MGRHEDFGDSKKENNESAWDAYGSHNILSIKTYVYIYYSKSGIVPWNSGQ